MVLRLPSKLAYIKWLMLVERISDVLQAPKYVRYSIEVIFSSLLLHI